MSDTGSSDESSITQPPAPALGTQTLLDRPWFRRGVITVLLGLAVGFGAYAVGNSVTGSDNVSTSLPDSVERLIPTSGSEVLKQSEVGVDLALGYDAYLIINGVEIRDVSSRDNGDGLTRVLTPDGYTVTYVPGPGKRVEQLEPELNQITAMVWRQESGPETAVPVFWTFNAA